MNILIIGAGAIGGFIGGQLAAQHNVTLFDRAPLVEAVRARGLRIITPESEHTVTNLAAFTSLEEIFTHTPRFDLALISMKAFDTPTAIQVLRPYADRIERFLTPQNGIDNEDLLGAAFGRAKIISGTVLNPIAVPEIGVVRLEKIGRGIGLAPVDSPIEPYVDVIRATQLLVRTYADYRAMKWSKLILNLIGNATSAILDMPTRETFADERVFKIEVQMLREALAVMRAQSIGPVDLPGSPVRLLAFGIRFAPLFILQRILQPMVGGGRGDKPPSLLVDMRSGRTQSEIDALNGTIVKAGKSIGVPTPVNVVLVGIVHDLLAGKADRSEWRRNIDRLVELTRV
ncbi:MAG TPA: 2-dehydropantoate 2-reductase [Anaerolineae bacterium]|nr:2-dehydropantoate 2-reductase [Anaerolineae bacterium]